LAIIDLEQSGDRIVAHVCWARRHQWAGRIDPASASAELKGDRNMKEDQDKRFADKSARMTRESLEKGVAAAEETARSIE
jgi:hypothetical protein